VVSEVGAMHPQLRRDTLAEQVAERLIVLIEHDELAPGTLLPAEGKLALEFGVSRPGVREALKVLAAKDIVAIANGKGAIVRPMTSAPLRDFFQRALRNRHATAVELLEVRKGIEVQSATLAAQRRTAEELSELTGILPALCEAVHDPVAFVTIDTRFHLLVAAASHNKLLHHLIESIRDPMQESMREVSRRRVTEEQHAFAFTAHARIVDTIERAAPEAAGSAMAAHFDVTISLVQGDTDKEFA
jgi:GntR family transcriptional regulator, transcriptional repressor for pyruvate dehydrogenase complex